MLFHLISEEDIKEDRICPYCKTDFKGEMLDTIFDSEAHYKGIKCSCGKIVHFKVGFGGSGHDHLSKEKKKEESKKKETSEGVKTIESKIKLLEPT